MRLRKLLLGVVMAAALLIVGADTAAADNCTGPADTQNCGAAINATVWATAVVAAAAAAVGGGVVSGVPTTKLEGDTPEELEDKLRDNCREGLAELGRMHSDISQRVVHELKFQQGLKAQDKTLASMHNIVTLDKVRAIAWLIAGGAAAIAAAFQLAAATAAAGATTVGTGATIKQTILTRLLPFFGPTTGGTAGAVATGTIVPTSQGWIQKIGKWTGLGGQHIGPATDQQKFAVHDLKQLIPRYERELQRNWEVSSRRVWEIDRLAQNYKVLYDRWMGECGEVMGARPPSPGRWDAHLHGTWGADGIARQATLERWGGRAGAPLPPPGG